MNLKATCRECMKRVDADKTFHASKLGGGSYNRAPRSNRATICMACATHLLTQVTPGHYRVSCWDVQGLRFGLRVELPLLSPKAAFTDRPAPDGTLWPARVDPASVGDVIKAFREDTGGATTDSMENG